MPMNTGRKKGPVFTYKYNRALDFWKEKEKDNIDAEPVDEKKCLFNFWKEREALGDQQQKKKCHSFSANKPNKPPEEISDETNLAGTTMGYQCSEEPMSVSVVASSFDSGDCLSHKIDILENEDTGKTCQNIQQPTSLESRPNDGKSATKCGSGYSSESSSQSSQTTKKVCFDPYVVTIEASNEVAGEDVLLSESDHSEVGLLRPEYGGGVTGDENVDMDETSFAGSELWEMETLTDDQLAVMLHLRDGIKIKETDSENRVGLDIDVGLCDFFSTKDNSDRPSREEMLGNNKMSKRPNDTKCNGENYSQEKQPRLKKCSIDPTPEKDFSAVESKYEQVDMSVEESAAVFSSPFKFQRYRYIEKNFSESTEGSDSGEMIDDEEKIEEGVAENGLDSVRAGKNVTCKRKLYEIQHPDRSQDFSSDTCAVKVGNVQSSFTSLSDSQNSIMNAEVKCYLQQPTINKEAMCSNLPCLDHSTTQTRHCEMYVDESLPPRECYSDEYSTDQSDMFFISPRSRSATEVLTSLNNSTDMQDFIFYDKITEDIDTHVGYCSTQKENFVAPRNSLADTKLARCDLPKLESCEEVYPVEIQPWVLESTLPHLPIRSSEPPVKGLVCNDNVVESRGECNKTSPLGCWNRNTTNMDGDNSPVNQGQPSAVADSCNTTKRGRHFMSQDEFIQKRHLREQNEFPWSNENMIDSLGGHVLKNWQNDSQESTMNEKGASAEFSDYSMLDDIVNGNCEMKLSDQDFTVKQIYVNNKVRTCWEDRSERSQDPSAQNIPPSQTNVYLTDVYEEPGEFLDEPGYDWKEDFIKWKRSRRSCPGDGFEKIPKRLIDSGCSEKCGIRGANKADENDEGKSPAISMSCSVPKSSDQNAVRKSLAKHTSRRPNCRFYLLQKTQSEICESENENGLGGGVYIIESKQGDFIVPSAPSTIHVDASSNTCDVSAVELLLHDEKFRKVKMIWAAGTIVFLIFCVMILYIDKTFPYQVSESEQRLYTLEQILLEYADL